MRQRAVSLVILIGFLVGCHQSTDPAHTNPPSTAVHPNGTVASSIALSGRPHGVTIAPNGEFCVSQIDASSIACGTISVTAVGPATEVNVALGPVIAVGLTPAHVALDPGGQVAYTADQSGNTATIVDVPNAHVVGSVPLGDNGFNVTTSRTRAYVTTAGGQLYVIDAATRQAITHLAVGAAANGLAIDTLGGTLYVSSRDAGTVVQINTATNTITRTFVVGTGAQRIALSPDRRTLFVASESAGLQSIDLTSGAVSTISGVATGAVGLALSPDGQRAYVANPPAGMLQIVDPVARQVVTSLTGLGRPRNVAFGANGAMALVTDELGRVIVIR